MRTISLEDSVDTRDHESMAVGAMGFSGSLAVAAVSLDAFAEGWVWRRSTLSNCDLSPPLPMFVREDRRGGAPEPVDNKCSQ